MTGADLSRFVLDDLSDLLRRCLSKSADERPSAESLSAALREVADRLGAPPLESIGPPKHARQPVRIEHLPAVKDTADVEPTVRAEIHALRPPQG